MDDIYRILMLHFSQQTNFEQEKKIAVFKQENPIEYAMLKKVWNAKKEHFNLIYFDTKKAFRNVKKQVHHQKSRRFTPWYAAAAIVFVLVLSGVFMHIFSIDIVKTLTPSYTYVAKHNKETITLKDGSVVSLNKGAKLRYPIAFLTSKREVFLEGEAFFEITKNKEKPFIVNTSQAIIGVLGTSFNVQQNATQTLVSVATGQVRVSDLNQKQRVVLGPGFQGTASLSGAVKSKIKNINYLSWKTGVFTFKNTPITSVITDLNTFYDTKIYLKSKQDIPIDCHITAVLEKKPIEEIIEILSLTCDTYTLHIK